MNPQRRGIRDIFTFVHGYDLQLVIGSGIGLCWLVQNATRTQTPGYKLINTALDFLPFHPMRAVGVLLLLIVLVSWIGGYRRTKLGFYGVFAQVLFWLVISLSVWAGAVTGNAGYSGVFFPLALALSAVQYLRAIVVMLNDEARDPKLAQWRKLGTFG